METTTTITTTMDNINDDIIANVQSSKLSLGSSPSVLSADEQLDGDGPLTPTDKIEDDDEEEETPQTIQEDESEDDDDLSALNSILQAGSPGSLSNEEVSDEEDDDLHTEQDSASPLSSVPDDFPLSRSASPELLPLEEESKSVEETVVEAIDDDDEEEVIEKKKQPMNRKRRKEPKSNSIMMDIDTISDSGGGPSPSKKSKQESSSSSLSPPEQQPPQPPNEEGEQHTSSEENRIEKRRASRSITNAIINEPISTRPRRRISKQDDYKKESEPKRLVEEDEIMQDKSSNEEEEEEVNSIKENVDHGITEKEVREPLLEQHDSQDQTLNANANAAEPQENNDQDCQLRHKEALDALTHIEIEFARLRDKMYQEKMSELNEEAIMIANGTHPELVTLMAEIEEKKGKRINSAEAWRKHQHANFRQQFEGFEYQANIHFISQKNALRRNLLSNINGKRWNIEDERTKLNDPARTYRVFPDGREMVSHKRDQKEETGELQDIKEAVGFPMAPNPTGLSIQDVDEDLKILGINR